MNAASIMTKVATILQDMKHTRWPLAELATWIDEGVAAIVMVKPAAGATNLVLPLVEGTRQALPEDPTIVQLLDIERNVASAAPGAVPGRSVRRTARADLDAFNPNWHSPAGAPYKKEVRQFTFDADAPREFFVYPGNTGEGFVDARVAKLPVTISSRAPENPADLGAWALVDVKLDDYYEPALTDYVLYRAFSKETPEAAPARAMTHYQAFATAIGIQTQVAQNNAPGGR